LAAVSLRPGGVFGLEPGQQLEDDGIPVLHRSSMGLTAAARHDFIDFLWDTERDYWGGLYRFLKEELGVRPLVSGTQLGYSPVSIQAKLDYIDAHSYWQHPHFPGRPWDPANWSVGNVALVNSPGGTLAGLAARRVAGLPFTVSEYNHPNPNVYAAEGFPMIVAMAGFQGWDGVFSFAYCHNTDFEPRRITSFFDIKADTVRLVHFPACAALFLRGDVSPARQTLLAPLSPADERRTLHETGDPWKLNADQFGIAAQQSLVHAIGLRLDEGGQATTPRPPAVATEPTKQFVSDTGQLRWDVSAAGAGYFAADTPRTKLFTGFVRGRTFELGDVRLRIGRTQEDWATVSLVCVDGAGFAAPGRILVAATGVMQNQDARLEQLGSERVTLGRQWGREPILCEGIPAEVVLPVRPERVTLYPLDEAGNRRAAVRVEQDANRAKLGLSPDHATLWYEAVIR
jgi:hypothetical protein